MEGSLKLIKCTNYLCNDKRLFDPILIRGDFSCANCGWTEYKITEVEIPKKRKEQIKFIQEFNLEDYE